MLERGARLHPAGEVILSIRDSSRLCAARKPSTRTSRRDLRIARHAGRQQAHHDLLRAASGASAREGAQSSGDHAETTTLDDRRPARSRRCARLHSVLGGAASRGTRARREFGHRPQHARGAGAQVRGDRGRGGHVGVPRRSGGRGAGDIFDHRLHAGRWRVMKTRTGPGTPIRFGTDGWRALIANEFTFENLARVAQAYADFLLQEPTSSHTPDRPDGPDEETLPHPHVVVGYDRRFYTISCAQCAAEVLAHQIPFQFRPRCADAAVSWACASAARRAASSHASHNPRPLPVQAQSDVGAARDAGDDVEVESDDARASFATPCRPRPARGCEPSKLPRAGGFLRRPRTADGSRGRARVDLSGTGGVASRAFCAAASSNRNYSRERTPSAASPRRRLTATSRRSTEGA